MNSKATVDAGHLPEGAALIANVARRQQRGRLYQTLLFLSTLVGILILVVLLYNVVNDAFGAVATQSAVNVNDLTGGRPLDQLTQPELVAVLEQNLRSRVLRNLNREQPLVERSSEQLLTLINTEIVKSELIEVYSLTDWLLRRDQIRAELAVSHPNAELTFRSWVSPEFLTRPMSSDATAAGVRTALLGSLFLLLVTVSVAFPLGIGTAIYLEEYVNEKPFDERRAFGRVLNAVFSRLGNVIAVNIYNLSGVPSIIYGMLGLAIFVRALEPLTSGAMFGSGSGDGTLNGRTLLSAGLTMALLVLPVVIIASQEALRAVPNSLRQASFGLGATRWQTVQRVVLPHALPGILTGTILAVSRAIGETAPLIVVGASTFILTDPSGVFSKFTVLPIQIYNWTSRPQPEFRAIAAAAIIVLLTLLLTFNAVAIVLRNYLRARRVG